jgi:DDE superfamily endonuclease
MQVALRRLASKVGTPTFGAEFFRPYVNLRYLVDKELMSDSKFRTEFRVNRATFHQLHDALQFPPMTRNANRLALKPSHALLILLQRLGELSRQSAGAGFSGRDRSAISRIVKLTCCMITARWFAAHLLDPHQLTRQRLAQYVRVIESHGSPFPKLVGFLDGSRYAILDLPDKGVQNACWSTKYKSNVAYQGVVGPDGIVWDFMGPFAGSKADGSIFIESTLQARIVANLLGYQLFPDTACPMSQVFTGIKATENVLEIAYNILMASLRTVIERIFGCLNKMFPLLRSPEKLCLGNGNIGTNIAAAMILYI